MPFLSTFVLLLVGAVLLVPVSRRLGFGSVLGYLAAGLAIGPAGFGLITNVGTIAHVSEMGVVMLLFLIGLELRPARLWTMRKAVLGLGGAQVVATGGALSLAAHLAGFAWPPAIVAGFALALSSTAIVLPLLAERDLLQTRAGRDIFSVLLFQDLAFIPLIALVPLLAGQSGAGVAQPPDLLAVGRGVVVIAAILLGGRYVVRSVFRILNRVRTQELFTAAALLIVAGTALLVGVAGLSMSLGAFIAGVLLSDSEYRHELRADIEPFQVLLLGFFFMSVGMGANVALLMHDPASVAAIVLALVVIKALIGFVLGRVAGHDTENAIRLAAALPQGSEFGFVLFGVAIGVGAMDREQADLGMLVVALSMIATPILFSAEERWVAPRFGRTDQKSFDRIEERSNPIIICGFGRVGQIVGRILRMNGLGFTALDHDVERVNVARRYGNRVYYGDPTRADLLRAAGAEEARALVIAVDDVESSLRLAELVRRNYPHLKVFARARDRNHAHLLMDRGIVNIVRETLHGSLRLSESLLREVGIAPNVAKQAIELFEDHDARVLRQQQAFRQDEKRLIQSTRDAAFELNALFEADRLDRLVALDVASEPAAAGDH